MRKGLPSPLGESRGATPTEIHQQHQQGLALAPSEAKSWKICQGGEREQQRERRRRAGMCSEESYRAGLSQRLRSKPLDQGQGNSFNLSQSGIVKL